MPRQSILTRSAVLACATVLAAGTAAPVSADGTRLDWPLRPRPAVMRIFEAPEAKWRRGHRGVDLAGAQGQQVYAAAAGTVVFSGDLAGRPLVSVAHPGGLRTTYEPVLPSVRRGELVAAGTPLGVLAPGHAGCTGSCLHWGALWGPASRADYVDPVGLLATTPIRLKPVR